MQVIQPRSIEELGKFVLQTLCTHADLEPSVTPMVQRTLQRGSRPCGIFFHVQGPRLVKLYATWATEDNRIRFYDHQGRRFAESIVIDGPDLTAENHKS